MNRIRKVLSLGIFIGILIPFCQSVVVVLVNAFRSGIPFSFSTLPFYSQLFVNGFLVYLFLYFVQSILAVEFIALLSHYAQLKWVGLFAGVTAGILVDIPYALFRWVNYFQIPLDFLNLIVPILIFSVVGVYVFKKRDWDADPQSKEEPQHPVSPPSPAPESISLPSLHRVLPEIQNKIKTRPYPIIALFILIPSLLCICLVLSTALFFSYKTLPPTTFSDNLWSFRISQKLDDRGFSPQGVTITRDKTQNIFSHMDIKVGIDHLQDYVEYQDVIEAVHKCVFEALPTPVFQPEGLGEIDVYINNESIGYYRVSIDYEIARQYELGKISHHDYIQHWRFNQNPPGGG